MHLDTDSPKTLNSNMSASFTIKCPLLRHLWIGTLRWQSAQTKSSSQMPDHWSTIQGESLIAAIEWADFLSFFSIFFDSLYLIEGTLAISSPDFQQCIFVDLTQKSWSCKIHGDGGKNFTHVKTQNKEQSCQGSFQG